MQQPTPATKGKAVLFGLNYSATPNAKLNGCINDVTNMSKYLKSKMNIPCTIFTDESNPQDTTGQGMIRRLYELAVQSFSENLDFVWIHYSGHGTYIIDKNGDEKDGQDECLVPSDFSTKGLISDDIIQSIFRHFNPKTRVICVFDCCHSGTIGDVKYNWEGPRKCTIENITCSAPAKIITLSGCTDTQTSADAFNVMGDKQFTGAMTSCLLAVFNENQMAVKDVFQVLTLLRNKLKEKGFSQFPKLCSTHNLARDPKFLP